MPNPFRYVAEKLMEPASPDLWPLAVIYFNPKTRGLQAALASVGAELLLGHGRKVGVIIESQARLLCRQQPGSAKGVTMKPLRAPRPAPLAAESVEGE